MNHNPTDKEHARYEVLQRFYEGTDMLKEEIITDLKPEPEQRATGIRAMVNAAFHVDPSTEAGELEIETRPTSALRSMIEAASGKGSIKSEQHEPVRHSVIQRQMQPTDFEYQLPEICNDSCFIKRHCGAYPAQVGNLCVKRSEQFKNKERIIK